MNLGVFTRKTEPDTFLFLTPGGDEGEGAGIYRDDGTLVWWLHPGAPIDQDLTVVHYHDHAYLAMFAGHRVHQHDYGSIWLYNHNYKRVGTVTAGGRLRTAGIDLHEFKVTPAGDALIAIDPKVTINVGGHPTRVFDYVVQRVALVHDASGIHTGRVLFQWSALHHVPVSQSHVPPPKGRPWDWFHGNAISQDRDGNLLVSSRNTWGIYKINSRTGRIMWQVGATGDHTLADPWCYQHDVLPLGQDRYSLFDDGGGDPGCVEGATAHPSRGLIIKVNRTRRPVGVRLIRAYPHRPAIYAGICGSEQHLADGNSVVGWGDVPEVTEYSQDGGRLMDLSLTRWSYRAFRFPWVGAPRTRPALAAQRTATSTTVWASWNGSTEVAAWRVLAGVASTDLVAVTGAVPKTGFESTISLKRSYSSVAVQALSASGAVLATSRPIAPS
jgi:Arylsulfotransferase (ASST)